MHLRRLLGILAFLTTCAAAAAEEGPRTVPDAFQGADRKLLEAALGALDAYPDLYFYVAVNAYDEDVYRVSRRPLDRPDGRHPDAPPVFRDVILESFGAAPSKEAVQLLKEAFRARNQQLAAQKKPLPPPQVAAKKPDAPPLVRQPPPPAPKPAVVPQPLVPQPVVPQPVVPPAPAVPFVAPTGPAPVRRPGERFSTDAQELLAALGGPYELDRKEVSPEATEERFKRDAELVLRLTESTEPELQRAAHLTLVLQRLRVAQLQAAGGRGKDLAERLKDRFDGALKRARENGWLDLSKEFHELDRDGKGGVLGGDDFLGFGRMIQAELITKEFRLHNEMQRQNLLIGAISAASRGLLARLADQGAASETPAAEGAPAKPFDVYLDHRPQSVSRLQLTNRSRKTLHHVLVATGCTADPQLVQRTAGMQGLGFALVEGLFPDEAAKEAPEALQLWMQIQSLEFGAVAYIPELAPGAVVRVDLCVEQRLQLTQSAEASVWSDELSAKKLPPSNLKKVLDELRAPAKGPFAAPPKGAFAPPGAAKPPTAAQKANELARQKAERDRNAASMVDLARRAIVRKDVQTAQAYLTQAIESAPDSAAARQARQMLKQLEK